MFEFDNNHHNPQIGTHMLFTEAMRNVEKAAALRNAELCTAWERFYDACTVTDVCYYIRDYLADYDLSGIRLRSTYDLDITVCLAEALDRALYRQPDSNKQLGNIKAVLDDYNTTVHSYRLDKASVGDLAESRLSLAAAMLVVD